MVYLHDQVLDLVHQTPEHREAGSRRRSADRARCRPQSHGRLERHRGVERRAQKDEESAQRGARPSPTATRVAGPVRSAVGARCSGVSRARRERTEWSRRLCRSLNSLRRIPLSGAPQQSHQSAQVSALRPSQRPSSRPPRRAAATPPPHGDPPPPTLTDSASPAPAAQSGALPL